MNFIGIYDDLLNADESRIIIDYFKKHHEDHREGQLGYGFVNPEYKDSTDLYCCFSDPSSLFTFTLLYNALASGFKAYEDSHEGLKYTDKFSLYDSFNIQYYKPGGGFKIWHHETTNFTNYPNPQTTRALAWMVNLNDCPGGGTHFMEQDFTMEAKRGRVSIWPAAWTHIHKGQISETHEKYIATGWFNYETPNV